METGEHEFGLSLETLDNPGWALRIDLTDTELETKPFERLETERGDDDWVHAWVAEKQFHAAGGPKNLDELLNVFRKWAEGEGS